MAMNKTAFVIFQSHERVILGLINNTLSIFVVQPSIQIKQIAGVINRIYFIVYQF